MSYDTRKKIGIIMLILFTMLFIIIGALNYETEWGQVVLVVGGAVAIAAYLSVALYLILTPDEL